MPADFAIFAPTRRFRLNFGSMVRAEMLSAKGKQQAENSFKGGLQGEPAGIPFPAFAARDSGSAGRCLETLDGNLR